jgi:hypothetical protein
MVAQKRGSLGQLPPSLVPYVFSYIEAELAMGMGNVTQIACCRVEGPMTTAKLSVFPASFQNSAEPGRWARSLPQVIQEGLKKHRARHGNSFTETSSSGRWPCSLKPHSFWAQVDRPVPSTFP